jgi:chorismate mutase
MNLKEIRKKIDSIDGQILQLLNSRMEQVLIAKKFKTEVEDIKREKEILDRIRNRHTGLVQAGFIEKIYNAIIHESKRLQRDHYDLVAFQ